MVLDEKDSVLQKKSMPCYMEWNGIIYFDVFTGSKVFKSQNSQYIPYIQ